MASTTATFEGVSSFDGRAISFGDYRWVVRAIGRNAVMAFAAMAAIGLAGAIATMAAAWIVNTTLGARHMTPVTVSGMLARVNGDARSPLASTGAVALVRPQLPDAAPNQAIAKATDRTAVALLAPAPTSAPTHFAPLPPKAAERSAPLPRPRPALPEIAQPPVRETAPQPIPQVAVVTPPPAVHTEKRVAPQEAHNKAFVLPDRDSRTAVYDISARTVYLPNGEKLEAHSGLGDKMDDPQHVRVRMRGPTPPNVYELTMREQLFHGVRAIRLNPVDEGRMYGRDGMLAHTYMLGPNGQSNGCVSFKNYDKFLQAFLDGKVDRLVVVPSGGIKTALTDPALSTPVTRREPVRRYASSYSRQIDEPRYTGALGFAPEERGAGTW